MSEALSEAVRVLSEISDELHERGDILLAVQLATQAGELEALSTPKGEEVCKPDGLSVSSTSSASRWDHMKEQPFEWYPELAKHIQRMSSTGTIGNCGAWSGFLGELNEICYRLAVEAAAATQAPTSPWRSIDDMPEDSRPVLVAARGNAPVVAFRGDFAPQWFVNPTGMKLDWFEPTHFMELTDLPLPPVQEET